jgi:hypothetical protein
VRKVGRHDDRLLIFSGLSNLSSLGHVNVRETNFQRCRVKLQTGVSLHAAYRQGYLNESLC